MKTKLLFLALFLVCFTSANLFAQGPRGKGKGKGNGKEPKSAEERAQKHTDKFTMKLGLSEDQKKQVYDINLAAAKKHDEQRAKNQPGKGDRAQMMAGFKAIETERDSQISGVLTADQKVKYEQMKVDAKAKAAERMKNRGKGKGKGKVGDSMAYPEEDAEDEGGM